MARDLESGSSEYGEYSGAVITGVPCTLVAWVKTESFTSQGTALSLGINGGSQYLNIAINTSGQAAAGSSSAGSGTSTTTGAVTNGVWSHIAGVFATTTSRTAYLDGTAATANTTSSNPTGLNRTCLGFRWATTRGQFFDGLIAEAAIWDAALTAAEIASLAKGFSPLMVRPQNLVSYWPLLGNNSPEPDLVGPAAFTLTGTVKADHCRVFAPRRSRIVPVAPVAAAGLIGHGLVRSALLNRRRLAA